MMIAQPMLQRQSMEQAAMYFIAVQEVVVAVPSPVNCNQLTVRAQSIRQTARQGGQRFNVEVVTHFAEHNQIERPAFGRIIEIRSQVSAFDAYVMQAGTPSSRLLNRGL
jgi:hypothetical protein